MIARPGTIVALILLVPSTLAAGDAAQLVTGRILDEAGRPVSGADVSALWGANGMDVERARNSRPEQLWRKEGQMEPWGSVHVVTDTDGRFSIPAPNPSRKKTMLVYDRERRRGAVIRFNPEDLGKPVEARLRPLVKISGTTRLADAASPLKC